VADTPLVSVILPTRDRPDRLRIALASVLAQSYPAVEVIVVNDGGEDVSDVIAALDTRSQVVAIRLPESRERSAARNCGLRLARGKYVAYLDDDDWYDAEHVATLVEALERDGAAVAYTCARRVTEELRDGRWMPAKVDVPFRRFFDPTELLKGNYIPILTLAHRRDCLDAIGLFDEGLSALEDWELAIRLSRRWHFVAIPKLTCNFTWREPEGDAAQRRLLAFVRSTDVIYRRYAAEAEAHPEVAEVHATFFRKAAELGVEPISG
jgi:glycosyltransferase involved in cell wall biosynthesis